MSSEANEMNYVMYFRGNLKVPLLFLVGLMMLEYCLAEQTEDTDTYLSRFLADLWLEGADVVKIIWRDCSKKLADVKDVTDKKEFYPKFMKCMKRKSLRALDRSLSIDVVPIANGVNLVKFEMVDRSGNVMPENNTSTWTEKDLDEFDWRTLALQRIAKVLHTHVIKFEFDDDKKMEKVEQRGRRRHHMMTMMMFGIVSIGMVLIPMGFQFLAVLGGKALLLAKMALILASIQGLKKVDTFYEGFHDGGKIASSPLNYGFYHNYSPYDHLEKRSNDVLLLPASSASIAKLPWSKKDGLLTTDEVNRALFASGGKFVKRTSMSNRVWNPMLSQMKDSPGSRHFPTYSESVDLPINTLDSSSSFIETTPRPGEVQADYSLELPYNGLHFQSPTTVISA